MNNILKFLAAVPLLPVLLLNPADIQGQGALNPVTPPGETMKSLEDIYTLLEGQPVAIRASDIPLTITESGSYRLVEPIEVSTEDQTAITINADDVFLDLNGFAVIGPGAAAGSSGDGIFSANQRVTVVNGMLLDWRNDGLQLGDSSYVRRVQVKNVGGDGIEVGTGSLVTLVTARGCAASAITAGDHSTVTRCATSFNTLNGIVAGAKSTVSYCTSDNNQGGNAIMVGNGSVVTRCNARFSNYGIDVADRCTVTLNISQDNSVSGIAAGDGNLIRHNVCNDNDFDGISLGNGNRVVENNCIANFNSADSSGIRAYGEGNVIQRNSANQNRYGVKFDVSDGYSSQNYLRQNTVANEDLNGSTEGTGDLANITY